MLLLSMAHCTTEQQQPVQLVHWSCPCICATSSHYPPVNARTTLPLLSRCARGLDGWLLQDLCKCSLELLYGGVQLLLWWHMLLLLIGTDTCAPCCCDDALHVTSIRVEQQIKATHTETG
jgi:hypothetical protein